MQKPPGSTENETCSQPAIYNPRRAPKSRGGCLRCKAKRLKCDETKPGCNQCSRKNVACPGYKSKALVWSTKHEKMLVPGQEAPFPAPSTTLAFNLTEAISGSRNDPVYETSDSRPESKEVLDETSANLKAHSPPEPTHLRRDSNPPTDSLSAIRQQLNRSTVPEFLLHLPTMLVEYYFSYVCQIFSSFDGTLNPFRSTVGRLWDGSAPIYYAIQSMAAAYLANHFPRMLPVGVQMQRETYRCLYQLPHGGSKGAGENLDKTLLTVLLVGQTTAWHDPKDLGLVHLKTAKRLNRRRLEQQQATPVDSRAQRQNEFFEQCILYWDMLAGFVEDDVDEFGFGEFELTEYFTPSPGAESSSSDDNGQVFPHPWTGVAPKVQKLFAHVGRVIRRYRKSVAQDAASVNLLAMDLGFDIDFPQDSLATLEATAKAQSLEEELLAVELPLPSNLVDAGDENTPVQQYLILAEAYRCAALLEIYRVFPSVLSRRVPYTDSGFTASDMPDQELHDALPIPVSQPPDDFLVSLAIHTISLLEKLPPTSGTRCLQPIVLIVAASELRYPSTSLSSFSLPLSPNSLPIGDHLPTYMPASSSIFNSLTNREVDIATARRFVTTRLQEYQLSLPAKPILRAEMLVRETWRRSDDGLGMNGEGVFWMDVMDEMGWGTIYG
ncbi:uncharacterized protein LY89DRAFT_585266 [Mollisia scopiformis]|uniref:Zn(2)-C6 fungal-type domain-containing protein n=1 Tax=Mollisia scopiformis TaxID=149040 RepID=A0A194XAE0_MOLSC|nr:uncharacterized protein LY89DRAFT_585266 [Mollisia scopiformis]KUJ16732.1 hypothetical protein LY89DRAFT_585266 [Mollisia scopiformis]